MEAVERHDCPNCDAPASSAYRTRGGKTAAKYHTPRFVLVPATPTARGSKARRSPPCPRPRTERPVRIGVGSCPEPGMDAPGREEPDRFRVFGIGNIAQMAGQPALERADVLVDGGQDLACHRKFLQLNG